jgi:alkylhydroperoxidase family enzyme
MSDPRLEPLRPREWPPEMRAALAPLTPPTPRAPDHPKGLNLLGTFARHPALTAAYHGFVAHLLYESTLTDRQRELTILRVAGVRGADYEFAQHVVLALDVGLTRDEIAAVRGDIDPNRWGSSETALLSAVDELVNDAQVSEQTYQALVAELTDQQLLDLVFTVGAYDLLAMVLHTFKVQLDDDLLPWSPS